MLRTMLVYQVNILTQFIIQAFCEFYHYTLFKNDWITVIMGHNKRELSTKNMLYSLPKLSYNTPTSS